MDKFTHRTKQHRRNFNMTEENEKQENPENLPVPAPKAPVPIVNGKFVPTDFDGLWRIANVMASTDMVPDRYKNNTPDTFVALSMGMEIGLSNMGSLQNISVVNGMPTVFADGVTGLIQGSGMLEWMEEGFRDGDKEVDPSDLPVKLGEWPDTLKAYCHMKRKGQEKVYKGTFSVADAKRMGKWMYKEKSVWSQHPARMLTWRARTWPCRDGFSDILKGLKIYEEVVDYAADLEDTNGKYEVVEPKLTKVPEEKVVEDERVPGKTLFESMCDEEKINHGLAMDYIEEIAEVTGAPIITITTKAINNKDEFVGKFAAWAQVQSEAMKEKEFSANAETNDTTESSEPDDVKNTSSDQPDGHSEKEQEAADTTTSGHADGENGDSVDDLRPGQADEASSSQKTTIRKWGGLRGVDFKEYVPEHPDDFLGISAEEYAKAVKKWNSLVYARSKDEWPLKSTEKQPEIDFPEQSIKQHLTEIKKDYPTEVDKSLEFRGFARGGLSEDASKIVLQDVIDIMGGKVLVK
jgi:hypothetical protein